ncbi:hypothetical protein [Parafrankia discariae]|uniref:hypothetical protein n=1 Tax=Parafrankia discariae TaxID=365528 RepID=UPI0003A06FB9|nr:hypothetical protein [Parafrankia discariae]
MSEEATVQVAPAGTRTTSRRFELHRDTDVSGVSGVGIVAHGVEWPDGTASVYWRAGAAGYASAVFWPDGLRAVDTVHGHNGRTRIVWLDADGRVDP